MGVYALHSQTFITDTCLPFIVCLECRTPRPQADNFKLDLDLILIEKSCGPHIKSCMAMWQLLVDISLVELKTLFKEGDPISINTNLPWGPQHMTSYTYHHTLNQLEQIIKQNYLNIVAKNTRFFFMLYLILICIFALYLLINQTKLKSL